MAFGATLMRFGMIDFMMLIVAPARSRRDWPGFWRAPAVMTTMSASRQISGSSEPSIDTVGKKLEPCCMSSTSASTRSFAMS